MTVERTFSIIKPDATARNLTGAINAMIEQAGLRIIAQKRVRISRAQARLRLYLLELAEAQGARVFNRPRAIRDWNEKMSVARFPQFAPPTVVTRSEALILSSAGVTVVLALTAILLSRQPLRRPSRAHWLVLVAASN